MDRSITQTLLEWKKQPRRKPLILRGPRQVGKTYIIEKFGKDHFKTQVTLNFELSPHLKQCFDTLEPDQILSNLELVLGISIPNESTTLLLLDEIQECPKAIVALRYFKEKEMPIGVIAAGSLLEFALEKAEYQMPVGRVQYLYLRPLSFEEYLSARGFAKLADFLNQVTLNDSIPEAVHLQLIRLLREYIIIGGMPEAVSEYLLTSRYQSCQSAQENLLLTFRDDFGKYAKQSQIQYLQAIFERAPALVGEQFTFNKIDPGLRARELKPALRCLVMAGLVQLIYKNNSSGLPLVIGRDSERFKLHFLDIGLMTKATRLPAELLLREDFFALNRGSTMEQLVGQELLAYTPATEEGTLNYWSRDKKGSAAEVDFITTIENYIIPIEVKAGSTGRLKSLQLFMEEKKTPLGVKISLEPLALKQNILCLPAYMIFALPRLAWGHINPQR